MPSRLSGYLAPVQSQTPPALSQKTSSKRGHLYSFPPSSKALKVATCIVPVAALTLMIPGALPLALTIGSISAIGVTSAAIGFGIFKGTSSAVKASRAFARQF